MDISGFTASLLAWNAPNNAYGLSGGDGSTIEEWAHGVGRVLMGIVRHSRSEYARDRGGSELIVTRHQIDVTETFKGPRSASVEMVTEGGTVGDITLIVPDSPSVRQGEEILVFLNGGPEGWTPQGGTSGVLRVEKGTDRVRGASFTLKTIREYLRRVV
jgi:hypothetical protein